LASCAPLAQEASAVPTINNATRRIMTTDEGTFSIRANYGKLKFKLGHSVQCGYPPRSDFCGRAIPLTRFCEKSKRMALSLARGLPTKMSVGMLLLCVLPPLKLYRFGAGDHYGKGKSIRDER